MSIYDLSLCGLTRLRFLLSEVKIKTSKSAFLRLLRHLLTPLTLARCFLDVGPTYFREGVILI